MKYQNIRVGHFISRPNRFIAKIEIEGAEEIVHVKNTGRCAELLVPGAEVYVQDSLQEAEDWLSDRIGNVYTGVISGVTKWGMYVELPNTIEGLIHVANMRDDHYNYDESRYEMVGERTGKVYKLGQEVRVRVADTDRLMRTIDFVIAKERDEENGEDEW